MSLKDILKSAKNGDILIPRLRQFVYQQWEDESKSRDAHERMVIADAQMTIDCFQERADKYAEEEAAYAGYFHPSSIGGCLRKKWFSQRNVEPDVGSSDGSLRSYLIFETGTYLHVMFQNLCEHAGLLIGRELLVEDHDLRIVGHADGMLEIDSDHYMLEFKTINQYGFTSLQSPHQAHIDQSTIYMKILKRRYPKLKGTLVVYYDKNAQNLREFLVPFNNQHCNTKVMPRIQKFFDNQKSLVTPDKEGAMPSAMPCKFCEFVKTCFDDNAVKAIEKRVKNESKSKKTNKRPKKNGSKADRTAKVRKTKVRRRFKIPRRST